MADPPRWFQSVVAVEVFLQLPFFFVACYGFWTGTDVTDGRRDEWAFCCGVCMWI